MIEKYNIIIQQSLQASSKPPVCQHSTNLLSGGQGMTCIVNAQFKEELFVTNRAFVWLAAFTDVHG